MLGAARQCALVLNKFVGGSDEQEGHMKGIGSVETPARITAMRALYLHPLRVDHLFVVLEDGSCLVLRWQDDGSGIRLPCSGARCVS